MVPGAVVGLSLQETDSEAVFLPPLNEWPFR